MDNVEQALNYIREQEATKIAYCKVGENSKNLVVSFAGNQHRGFERKRSLMKLKYERNDFDVLYLRNAGRWYLGELNGIGKNINHTLAFLKKELAGYDKVLCTGGSAGGYAGLLFGSLLEVEFVIVSRPQTDLEYCADNLPDAYSPKKSLLKRKGQHSSTWKKYNKIAKVLSENTTYYVWSKIDGGDYACGDGGCGPTNLPTGPNTEGVILHGRYHYDLIKDFPTVNKLNSTEDVLLKIEEIL